MTTRARKRGDWRPDWLSQHETNLNATTMKRPADVPVVAVTSKPTTKRTSDLVERSDGVLVARRDGWAEMRETVSWEEAKNEIEQLEATGHFARVPPGIEWDDAKGWHRPGGEDGDEVPTATTAGKGRGGKGKGRNRDSVSLFAEDEAK